ncbi:MAG: hypothetical protein ABSE76_00130 [Minisyncoccia bacterium]
MANYWVADPCACHQQLLVEKEVLQPPPSVYHPDHYRPVHPQVVAYHSQPKLLIIKREVPVAREGCSIIVDVKTEGESTIFVKSPVFEGGMSRGLVVEHDSTVHFPVPCELAFAEVGALCLNQDYSRVFNPEWFAFARGNLARGEHVLNAGHLLWLKHTQ